MKEKPQLRIARDAKKVWRISAIIVFSIFWLVTIAVFVVSIIFDFTLWPAIITAIIVLLLTVLFVFVIPPIRWSRWRYEIHEQEIYIQFGIFIVTQMLVPMTRVQHVDTQQGPILKKFNLANVTISTAATTHEIPALREDEATQLRDDISRFAMVEDEDV